MFEELTLFDLPTNEEHLLEKTHSSLNSHGVSSFSSRRKYFKVITTVVLTSLAIVAIACASTTASSTSNQWTEEEMLTSSTASSYVVDLTPNVLFSVGIAAGFLLCFFGYRLYKPALFLSGALTGSIFVYDISHEYLKTQEDGEIILALVCLASGLVFGAATLCFFHINLFLLGGATGVLFANYLHTSILYELYPTRPEIVLYAAMGLFGTLFGYLAYMKEKPIIIACTSYIGSYFIVRGFGFFMGNYPSPINISPFFQEDSTWWYYFFATLGMFLSGFLIQLRITARNVFYYHKKQSTKNHDSDDHSEHGRGEQYQLFSEQPTQLI